MKNNYKSTLTIVLGFILISVYFNLKPLLIISIIIGLAAIISEKLNDIIIRIWGKLTAILGLIMPNILLTIVFYLFLTPLALINRLYKNKNQIQLINSSKSTFIVNKRDFSSESLEKIW